MKNQFLGIFFYLLYLLAMVRPIVPLIEYYANYDYIANVLCENRDKPFLECNGKCYLEKQIKKVNHDNHNHNSTVPQIDFEKYPVSTLDYFSYKINDFNENVFYKFLIKTDSKQNFFTSLLKPPQLV